MRIAIDRCPDCGGGPVSSFDWERTARGIVPVRSRCNNCGHVFEVGPDERRVVETV